MVAANNLVLEPDAPGWAQRLLLRLKAYFQPLQPVDPVRLPAFASTALPVPAKWAGCAVYASDTKVVLISNGTAWVEPANGGNPLALPSFASTGLPAAASWTGRIIYVSDKKKVGLSNGTGWTDPAGGVL